MMEDNDKEQRWNKLERDYPGITSNIRYFEEAELPSCTHCGSNDTASVQIGIIGRTIAIAGMTRKFFLIPNGPAPGKYFCGKCDSTSTKKRDLGDQRLFLSNCWG